MNIYRRKSDPSLNSWAANFAGVVSGNVSGYKTTNLKVTAATDKNDLFGVAIANWETAKAALAAASDAKAFAREQLLSAVFVVANDIYVGKVSDSMVSNCGLEPRDHTRSTVTALQPTNLQAVPNAVGTVSLKWNRNGNAKGMGFAVEATVDNENWTAVSMTTKTRITLAGYAPGDLAYFRVRAIKDGDASAPSNTEAIYLPTPSGSNLKLAA